MPNHFTSGNFLIPASSSFESWAVIACDQYTSDPEYWQNVRRNVAGAPSTLHMIIPEAELHMSGNDVTQKVCDTMDTYLNSGVFKEYPNAYVYVERTLLDGSVRQGIVGMVDLDTYDYDPKENTRIFATEQTVLQRVPPRVAVRREASLEFSHVVMFCDDPEMTLIEAVGSKKSQLPLIYDFDLMAGGGHLSGWLLDGKAAEVFEKAVSVYEANHAYLVGDGNHSLVTAKLCYEEFKKKNPVETWAASPACYAMVELENIHSDAMAFEPIYRVVTCADPNKLVSDLQVLDSVSGVPVTWIIGEKEGVVRIPVEEGKLPIEALQVFLDGWVADNRAEIDYIHGEDSTRDLAKRDGNVGLLVPDLGKQILFPYVLSGKVMPRKNFSIGHAAEKRYYLEGRKNK